ncbi:hypothetical protein JQV27_11985 [Sulfitobacter mediterraneus]|uniref:hypothetical protein n=1 Tax=Sulfitobacter mediterraneus TaxID=83219 RepID=UPI001931D450|nr:hypothetical protein [Sulfitobacter mediterraneus]MBM1634132.1 hypothetical protein [Sulfitobacter mediterraneus]MBM1641353.1 hypothetical protein [Sulfitobacter mediterraneus]MBM1645997.1 hypothetical protein [Sulfitobacter mediterraneus]MBM1649472.1 hypothetical protein [Sulfitobacter mediterraneus]MBM1654065.1 hypothetical protein [Sulfitobacter mediterraneus]
MWSLETFGRVRLSRYFYMRDFMYSEISGFHGLPNVPENPDLVIENGKAFCTALLDPLEQTFGRVAVRSGYRAPDLNRYGNENRLNCARNDNPLECHIWDRGVGDAAIAGASVVIPWFADRYAEGRDWRDLAWWIHDHLPYSEMWFFPKLAAFNLVWRPKPLRTISSYIAPRGTLLKAGEAPLITLAERQKAYADFPPFKGIALPL